MKTFIFSALALIALANTNAHAHNIHNVASDHTHPNNYHYTHSVSSHYNHHAAHHYNRSHQNHKKHYYAPKFTTNTATYYTRSYPTTNTYRYAQPANTTIHQPPFAYSSCAGACSQNVSNPITVTSKTGGQTFTYRAPSEYNANQHQITTPRKITNCNQSQNKSFGATYVSPYRTHKITTTSCNSYRCRY